MYTRSPTERDLPSFDITQPNSQFEAALMAWSFGFGISLMGVIAAFCALLQFRRFKLNSRRANAVCLGYLLALLGLTAAYYIPTALKQIRDSSGYHNYTWSPPTSAMILLFVTLWIADGALGYFLWTTWKGNRTVMALFGIGFLGIIILDFTVNLVSPILAGLYDFTAFCLFLVRYIKSRKAKVDAVGSRGHVRVAPPLAVVIGTGVFCAARGVWIASTWPVGGIGGFDIWPNPMIFAFAVAIQCVCITSFSAQPTTAKDDATISGSLNFEKELKIPISAPPVPKLG